MTKGPTLQPFDYVVTVIILAVPMLIGIGFAVKDKKKNTRLEYLLGGRQMSLLPVTMSMFVTFQSAISLIGLPTEVYRHGTGIIYFSVGLVFCYTILYFTFAPLIYPLEVTSIYEYLLLRYKSPAVRMLSTVIGCVQSICYLSITLLTPALAIQAVTGGISMWMSVLVVGGIGTIYTVIGGIKSVIWTDVFQTVIVYVGIFAIIIKGSVSVGGLDKAWSIANEAGRVKFFEFSPDPRVRMTVWGAVLGSMISWMITAYSQATLQRIRSLKSLKDAKMLYLTNIPLNFLYASVLVNVGVVTFAYFHHARCDPMKSGQISNSNQIVPFYVLHAMNDLPGMTGLYLATLFCGSLSTLSSGINSLAANTVEDFLQTPLKNVSERTATVCTKLAAAFHGILVCCLGYGAQYLKGPVIQMGLSIVSAFGAPVLGMFIIGGAVPWANKYGAIAGALTSLAFNLWISIGNQFHGRATAPLPPAPVDRCDNFSSTSYSDLMQTVTLNADSKVKEMTYQLVNGTSRADDSATEFGFFLYDVSYEWYAVYGLVVCVVVGLLVSFCTRDKNWQESSSITYLIFPLCRAFWNLKLSEDDKVSGNGVIDCKELAL